MASHSSPGIEYITTALAATGIEGVLNGLCLVLGAISIWLLTTRSPAFKTSPRKLSVLGCLFRSPLILGSILLVVVITTHWGCSMYRMLHGMTLFANQHYPKEFFDEITHPLYVLMCGLVVTAILLTDGLLVWRLWIVSDHCIYTMTVPCLAALAFLACAIRIFVFFAMASAAVKSNSDIPGANIYSSDLAKFIGACILITFMILVRNGTGDKKLKALMCIVIESAAIYRSASCKQSEA
ncbi:hypothetical protein CC1G_14376 [Coprinopsis cinerea okayama7|uniref:Uncharacterized protein n=1 Tax=Coprinopsis cinerea (strain Okayama-7 / 130 / ATCC MYA-4618 / FGSC 9003) TaxID=240176 RepID=D6RLY6_COPC7|nr:hypothetical protein CC1G_14376 [Coprinopsis cinerea okayama7\|eukprot:XP_002911379.1 hypothetical protein CC1G_14376 [Coprinopsis cinerea okayama7\